MNGRIVVFGGSGFIGRQVCRVLAADPRVDVVVRPGRDRLDLLDGTVDALAELLRETRPDAVVNCTGALSGSGHDLVRANTAVTAKLVEAITLATPGLRFVRLGSAGEYGRVPPDTSVTEDDPTDPVSEYGVSHLAATRLLDLASAAGQVDGITVRVFNPIGPGLHEENMLGRAARLIHDARRSGAGSICLGPLSAHRDFVDVRDVASGVVAALLAPDPGARVFNLASGRAVRSRELVRLLAAEAGFTGGIQERAAAPGRSAAVDWMRGDGSRAARLLGWTPAYELPDSVKAVWAGVDER
ncbi:NAD-dependent epimerase/dehydratase family protein [Polymorphospora lycopeni]|uniref:NAD-dependent epimerase/dehydratase family protein n=1 Tax=Polymorphospora lycopeni TaxID=3140240 RepID=A0ABV5CZR3_9ACTN